MGIVSKGAKCNVEVCEKDGARSLTTTKVENAGLRVSSVGKKSVLCKDHYKYFHCIVHSQNFLPEDLMYPENFVPHHDACASAYR